MIIILLFGALLFLSGKTYRGLSSYFIENACTESIDCNDGKVCCLFYQKDSGVCDYQESCPKIADLTSKQTLYLEKPFVMYAWFFYGALIVMAAMLFILMVIFFRKD